MQTLMLRNLCQRIGPLSLLWLIVLNSSVFGQENGARRHARVIEHLKKVAAAISSRSLKEIRSLEDWKEQRPKVRKELMYMLGLDPLPERTPLKSEVVGTLERAEYRIEKIVYQSLPGLYVTGNLYIPNRNGPTFPAILYVCGHSPHPLGAKWSYQDRAIWFAEHGYACLILDTLEFGEVAGIHHGIHDLNMWNWLSMGYTPAGVEVWNALRGIDYLESRPEIDKGRIGMTGTSGGGAATWFTAAVDERVTVAAPVCSTYTIGSQASHWVAAGQCDCIYFHNTFLVDFPVVGALIAPRPLAIFSGRKDGDFPPDGYHEVFQRVKKVYDLYAGPSGDSDRIKEVDEDIGHSDIPLFRKEARQWMNRWIKGDNSPLNIEPLPNDHRETPETLACLSKLPADAVNYSIHDHFVPVTKAKTLGTLDEWNGRRRELIKELKDKVFRWFPGEEIPLETQTSRNSGGWSTKYADFKDVVFDSEPGVPIRVQLYTPKNVTPDTPLLLTVKRPTDSIYPLDLDEHLPVLGRFTVLVLNPRLTEHPVTAFQHAEIERSASWVGRTTASMQVWDILRALQWAEAEKLPMRSVTVYGKGDMGVLGLYAGILDERISQVILNDPPNSHRQSPALLNVLRVTDIAEVAGAFAPRRLVVLGAMPSSFQYTQEIFALHSRSDKLLSARSLPEALEAWKY